MQLKFLNINIFEGGLFFDNILNFIDTEKPDILCLQEAFDCEQYPDLPRNYHSVEVLKKYLPDFYYYFDPEFIAIKKDKKLPIGNAIFSRWPIVEKKSFSLSPDFPFGEYSIIAPNNDWSTHPKNMQQAVIEIYGKEGDGNNEVQHLNVFNLHGVWGLDGDDNPARLKMSQIIVNAIKDNKKVILSGDFNVGANTQTILNIEKHLTNIFREEINNGKLISTFNMTHKTNPGYATAIVDMVFVSHDMRVMSKDVLEEDLSDHRGILVKVEI